MSAHEVGKVELVIDRAYKEGTTLGKTSYRLAREVVVGHKTSAIGIALESVIVEAPVDFIHVDGNSHQFGVLLEQSHPGIKVGSTVVAMHHCHEASVGGSHHVDHLVRLAEILLENNH